MNIADCNLIPLAELLKLVVTDPNWTMPRTKFMSVLGFVVLFNRQCPQYANVIQIVLTKYATGCMFRRVVSSTEGVSESVKDLIVDLVRWTGRTPTQLVFSTRHGIRHNPADPLMRLMADNNINWIPAAPEQRVSYAGTANLLDILDRRYRALCHSVGQHWLHGYYYIVQQMNRTADSDGLSPNARFYQRADARKALYFQELYYVVHDGLVKMGRFVAHSKDGLTYTFRLTDVEQMIIRDDPSDGL